TTFIALCVRLSTPLSTHLALSLLSFLKSHHITDLTILSSPDFKPNTPTDSLHLIRFPRSESDKAKVFSEEDGGKEAVKYANLDEDTVLNDHFLAVLGSLVMIEDLKTRVWLYPGKKDRWVHERVGSLGPAKDAMTALASVLSNLMSIPISDESLIATSDEFLPRRKAHMAAYEEDDQRKEDIRNALYI
ncbi:hypothetical protein HK102_007801, partial [Quaeritorhiza haematococci]